MEFESGIHNLKFCSLGIVLEGITEWTSSNLFHNFQPGQTIFTLGWNYFNLKFAVGSWNFDGNFVLYNEVKNLVDEPNKHFSYFWQNFSETL